MAEPRIKGALESAHFTFGVAPEVRAKLDACLKADSAHILPKMRGGKDGPHVTLIQTGLMKIRDRSPSLGILPITDRPETYGPSTAAAVFKYKGAKGIRRKGQPLDDVVGRMTITQMDDDLVYNNLIDPPPGPQPGPGPGPAPSPAAVVTAACTQNPMITLDGTNAPTVFLSPMSATDWITETQATFDTICSKPLGRNIVNSVQNKITVRPFPDRTAGASSSRTDGKESIEFTASALTTLSGPGTRADEGLFPRIVTYAGQTLPAI